MAYIAAGGTTGIKALIKAFVQTKFDSFDKDLIVDINIKLIGF
jgi:hypothetical protein